jgi:dienelactone hydrolase
MIPADTFWFTGVGGLKIQGWLMKPYGYQPGKAYPLVLSIHGGPHSNYGNVLFPEFQMLAGQGYWTLFTNPRGSSGYGHAFTFSTRGRWGMEDYQDLLQAVDVAIARAKGGVDTTRMAVLGGSYGGFMTNRIVGHTNRFRVAQTDRSIFNWYSWYGSSDAQGLTEYEFSGTPWEADSLYRALSPMTYANNMRTPMLIVHSEDDKRTPITDGEQLFMSLRKRGVPAEFVRYPRSFHGLSRTGPPWLLVDRLERIRTWFAHWLGTGDTAPAAATSPPCCCGGRCIWRWQAPCWLDRRSPSSVARGLRRPRPPLAALRRRLSPHHVPSSASSPGRIASSSSGRSWSATSKPSPRRATASITASSEKPRWAPRSSPSRFPARRTCTGSTTTGRSTRGSRIRACSARPRRRGTR